MFLFDKSRKQFDKASAQLDRIPEFSEKEMLAEGVLGEAISLSPEEWYEIKAALLANIKRETEELPSLAKQLPFLNTKGGVLDRARHSVAIQKLVLKKIQEM